MESILHGNKNSAHPCLIKDYGEDVVLIVSGLDILDIDGVHDDGWCWPQIRFRLRAHGPASELRLGVWLKPEETTTKNTLFSIWSDQTSTITTAVAFGEPFEIPLKVGLDKGHELIVRVSCAHRVAKSDDARTLSFVLSSLVLV